MFFPINYSFYLSSFSYSLVLLCPTPSPLAPVEMSNQKSIKDFVLPEKEIKRTKHQIESTPIKRKEIVFEQTEQIIEQTDLPNSKQIKSEIVNKYDNHQQEEERKFTVKTENKFSFLSKQKEFSLPGDKSNPTQPLNQNDLQDIKTRKSNLSYPSSIPLVKPIQSVQGKRFELASCLILLQNIFSLLDSVYIWNSGRDELCHFFKVKRAIENSIDKRISILHIVAIKLIFPEAFRFKKSSEKYFGKSVETFTFEMRNTSESESNELQVVEGKEADQTKNYKLFENSTKRKEMFHSKLLEYSLGFHDAYLREIGIEPIPLSKLNNWYPDFDVERRVKLPEVDENEALEILCNEKYSLKDFFKRRIELDLTPTTLKTENLESKFTQIDPPISKSVDTKSKLSLLERIREKEKNQLQNSILKSDQLNKSKFVTLLHLIDSLYILFASSKKTTFSKEEICTKLSASRTNPTSEQEIWSQITTLSSSLPNWIQIIKLKEQFYLKMICKLQLTEIKKQFDSNKDSV